MIHNSSDISKVAKIGRNVKIGPFCSVGDSVELEDNVELVSNVHIAGNSKVGKGTKIFPFACIGTEPQDLKYNNEPNSLIIGENNTIREYVTINPGTKGGGGKTIIGNNCLFMISSHVAHDCKVGNDVIIANNVPLGGHVTIEDSVVIGGNSAVGLRRKNYENKSIIDLGIAYKAIFSSKNLHENLNKINDEFGDNVLVKEVVNFIAKDKKRPICLPLNKE